MMMRTTHVLRTLMLGAVVFGGCKDGEETTMATTKSSQGDTDGASSTGAAMTGSTGVVGSTGVEPTGGPVTTSGSTGAECMFLMCGDMTVTEPECDIWNEDCPEGSKCMPWDNTGGNSWNATKCSPLDATPGLEGDECVGGGTDGVDDCDKHLLCWFTDNDTGIGRCINMCTGSAESPSCPNGQSCDISNNGSLILCLTACDPLVQSCPDGQICFQGAFDFICDFDASGEEGQYGDACAYINVCDYGLFCATPAAVPGCVSAEGCCSEYCDLSAPDNTCSGAPMQECVPWYDGTPPPGNENIGACAIPG
jgi:hypothetical protein